MVTYQFTVEQFQRLLSVVLANDAPDELANLVLLACTRPKNGVISVPVPSLDARALRELVQSRSIGEPALSALADLMARQVDAT